MRWPWQRTPASADPAPPDELAKAASPGQGGFEPGPMPGPTKPAGSDGVATYGGYSFSGERDPRLQGTEKWITYDNITLNVAIVSSAIVTWTNLGGSAKWTATPNKRGGKDAQRGADIVTEGLLEGQLSESWCSVVRKQLMKKFRGFALHEMTIRRRRDGMVVAADLLHRPQWTVQRWNKPDEQTAWVGIEQRTQTGGVKYVERSRLLYSVENTLGGGMEGVGVLRLLAEPVRVLELYQQWEGIGFQTDLRGIPSVRAPLAKLRQDATKAGAKTEPEIQAYIKSQTQFLVDFLLGHNKRPEQGVLLDSLPYTSQDAARTPSAIYEWAFDIVRGATSGMPEVGAAIARITRDCARIMSAEWMLLGDVGSGSDAMHEDKTAMFGLVVNSALRDVAADGTRDCATRLVALNGLDPETCTPTLTPEPVATAAVDAACRSLLLMMQAALDPRDPAINILRGRMDLPPAPEIDDSQWVLPRGAQLDELGPNGVPVPLATPKKPAPTAAPAKQPGQAGNVHARPAAAPAPNGGKS